MSIRIIFILAFGFLVNAKSIAQIERPIVSTLSKYSATAGEEITISGSNFTANSRVSFGGSAATFTFNSSTRITAIVPTSAVYGLVSVTDLSTGRSGSSSRFFTMSFGADGLSLADFDAGDDQDVFPETGTKQIWDICLCDLDEDNDLDAVTTHRSSNNINVHRNDNTSNIFFATPGTVGLSNPIDLGLESNIILCEDLNGDGMRDLIISTIEARTTKHINVYKNTYSGGSINLSEDYQIDIPQSTGGNRSINRIKIIDVDGDGKKDLLAGGNNEAAIFIYSNTSSLSDISFSNNPIIINMPDGFTSGSIVNAGELNGDDKPDIIVAGDGGVVILKNQSTPGSVLFDDLIFLDISGFKENLDIVDFNNDGLGDYVITNSNGSQFTVYTNTTPSFDSNIAFSQSFNFSYSGAWDVEAGDLDGDGLVDIVLTSIAGNLRVLKNTSSGSMVNFDPFIQLPLTSGGQSSKPVRNIKIADLNGDSKPDLAFAFDSQGSSDGVLSVVANRKCLVPSIAPLDSEVSFCYDIPFTLSGSRVFEATYKWSSTTPEVSFDDDTSENAAITVDGSGADPTTIAITLTISSNDGNCSESITKNYTAQEGAKSSLSTINNSATGIICGGDAFTLSSSVTAESYLWTLPDQSTLINTTGEVVISSASGSDAGSYSLQVQESGKCYGDETIIEIDIDIPPLLGIINEDLNDNFCLGTDEVVLTVPDYGFDLEWFKDGATTSNTTNTLTASETGTFTVEVKSDQGCITLTEPYEVFAITPPSAMITADAAICVDVSLDFDASSSTGEDGFAVTHTWDFKDGNTATGVSVSNTFTAANTYMVELTTSYDDVEICENIAAISVVVSEVPTINIINPEGSLEKCPSDSVRLELPQNYLSYLWSTGDTSFFTYAKTSDLESEITISAEVTTEVSCITTTETITISNYPNSGIEITASGFSNDNDTIALESGIKSVMLTAFTTGGKDYLWDTNDLSILSTTTGDMTEVFPQEAYTTVTATATDINTCTESQSIVIEKPGLQPRKTFSPNGDLLNDCWEIINSEDQAGCTIYIFDTRGSIVYEASSPFVENCVWNGQIDGTGGDAPEGVYFFVLKCSDKSSSQKGNILLAR